MNKSIKNDIIQASYQLFVQQGYSSTTMRQIADKCDIAVGNLSYHFPKKEDIIMQIHNDLLTFFLDNLPPDLYEKDPWVGYFAAEYSLAFGLNFNPAIRRLYLEAINHPSLRQEYYQTHFKLFKDFMSDEYPADEKLMFMSTVAMCSLEFNVLEEFVIDEGIETFDEILVNMFKTRLIFLGLSPEEYTKEIERGIKLGKRLHFDPVSQSVTLV